MPSRVVFGGRSGSVGQVGVGRVATSTWGKALGVAFKSDVFSVGLIFYQCAAMEDVTGFNQRNQANDGERLIENGLKKLKARYSDHIIEIIRLMLKFEENDRPSFIELSKLVLTENATDSPKAGK